MKEKLMKILPTIVGLFFQQKTTRSNISLLCRFLLVLIVIIAAYSIIFHFVMAWEGRDYPFPNGIYWTIVTMTTLGYGDITFYSDLGRMFSVLVLLSGLLFLIVLLPFTFIHFFYAPWLEAQKQARTPRKLPADTNGHILLSNPDSLTTALIAKLPQYGYNYTLIVPDQQKALELFDQNYKILLGDLDDMATYRQARADQARLVFFNHDDQVNTNAVFTLRELTPDTPIISAAESMASVDILEMAGCNQVYQFSGMLGRALARRVLGVSMQANVIGRFGELLIAETPAMRTPLEGKQVKESKLRETTGVNIVGIWERGKFNIPGPDTRLGSNTVLVLAGSREQLESYNEIYGIYNLSFHPVLILGGGRVGKAAAQALQESEIDYRIVERSARIAENREKHVLGNAADYHTLNQAGIHKAPSVIITTHDDNLNIYLTIYCRKLRPDIQIISRATQDRNISKLHQAGADLVMSYASMGANTIINHLKGDNVLMVAEGLDIFREKVPFSLRGKTLAQSNLRAKTGCNVIAIESLEKGTIINPTPDTDLNPEDELILIGTSEAEKSFLTTYKNNNTL